MSALEVVVSAAWNYATAVMTFVEQDLSFVSSGAVLEGRVFVPAEPASAVVFCHPHPQYGGDMDNSVVTAVVGALAARGWATLRFNFRGVGGSGGAFADGIGERADAGAALDALAAHCPGARLLLGGYSFGAAIALDLGLARDDVAAVLAVAPPFAVLPFDGRAERRRTDKPVLLITGDRDQFCPVVAFEAAADSLEPNVHAAVLPGVDHFFTGHEQVLADQVASLVRLLD